MLAREHLVTAGAVVERSQPERLRSVGRCGVHHEARILQSLALVACPQRHPRLQGAHGVVVHAHLAVAVEVVGQLRRCVQRGYRLFQDGVHLLQARLRLVDVAHQLAGELLVGQERVRAVRHLLHVGQHPVAARLGGHGPEEAQHVEVAERPQRQRLALDQVVVVVAQCAVVDVAQQAVHVRHHLEQVVVDGGHGVLHHGGPVVIGVQIASYRVAGVVPVLCQVLYGPAHHLLSVQAVRLHADIGAGEHVAESLCLREHLAFLLLLRGRHVEPVVARCQHQQGAEQPCRSGLVEYMLSLCHIVSCFAVTLGLLA